MVTLAAMRAAQQRSQDSWCAWIDPKGTLYAPGVVMAGVDLERLFIVRPPEKEVGRVAVKVAHSQAFAVIAVDLHSQPRDDRSRERLVRKLSLLAMEGGSTVLLLTDQRAARSLPLPVALRLEMRRTPDGIAVRIGKDRYGRGGLAKTVPLQSRPSLTLTG
jgi:recombination protein RecA